ncbi:hypothetical protein [Natronobacterium texcoconense]|uniref:Uncharacterized protein n=1 Tax=Natronobacterium texcoconense TaxID=1095778 RepID=A0A1H1IFV9_NATTX|nr:hypothetical protein [Natronobacterium texcoconense]SDR36603.1 hypothetical protein SAMN04489842_3536 [Natronobacterium texcoconense]
MYDLAANPWLVATVTLIALFVGGSAGLAGGGPISRQLAVATLITVAVGGGSYWFLCRLTLTVTGGTGTYRIPRPAHHRPRTERSDERRDATDSTTTNAR